MKNESLGRKLRRERQDKDIKQLELAAKAGIGAVRLCRIEKGKAEPKPDEVQRIKQALQELAA